MDQRRLVLVGVGIAALALLGLGLLIAQDDGAAPDRPPPPKVERPRPTPSTVPAPAPQFTRVQVPAPAGVDRPDFPAVRPEPADLAPDEYRAMNYAMDDVINGAREVCIRPWIDATDEPLTAEFVFDAVLYDGRMFDFGLRSLSAEVPGDVMDCMRDQAWFSEWPDFDLRGQLMLQRKVEVQNEAERFR